MSMLSTFFRTGFRCRPISARKAFSPAYIRWTSNAQAIENANISHSQFISQAKSSSKWDAKKGSGTIENGGLEPPGEDFENIVEGQGKLSPTSSHLFKLIIPLGYLTFANKDGSHAKNIDPPPPTVILLHPSQPLSHVSRLILASLAPATPTISFRSTSPRGVPFQWSESTDVGDFIRDAARAAKFSIYITYNAPSGSSGAKAKKGGEVKKEPHEVVIDIKVPTFEDRTRFLKRRLEITTQQLQDMEVLKQECDHEAHRGARRMALGGFGILVVYWGTVARLTFWDYGWDVMEPITYLSGLSTVVCGYLWFLYQGREVSYSSVLDRSVSARREALYKSRGLDIDRWVELVGEAKSLKREIGKIAEDYDEDRRAREEEGDKNNITDDDGEGEVRADAEKADIAEANTSKM